MCFVDRVFWSPSTCDIFWTQHWTEFVRRDGNLSFGSVLHVELGVEVKTESLQFSSGSFIDSPYRFESVVAGYATKNYRFSREIGLSVNRKVVWAFSDPFLYNDCALSFAESSMRWEVFSRSLIAGLNYWILPIRISIKSYRNQKAN